MVAEAARALREGYVYPEVGDAMANDLEAKMKTGSTTTWRTSRRRARITSDCRAVSNDRHIDVFVARQRRARRPTNTGRPSTRCAGELRVPEGRDPPGNIGYLQFDAFVDTDEAKATGAAAMAFLRHCDALIVDLRSNGGGSPEMIQFLTSYLFEERVHLNDMVDRDGKVVAEYWTLEDVPGERLRKDVPVFVLTSSRTFSGAEEFSYNLQNLNRATLVGETTGGGAHPVRGERLGERFIMTVPHMGPRTLSAIATGRGRAWSPTSTCRRARRWRRAGRSRATRSRIRGARSVRVRGVAVQPGPCDRTSGPDGR